MLLVSAPTMCLASKKGDLVNISNNHGGSSEVPFSHMHAFALQDIWQENNLVTKQVIIYFDYLLFYIFLLLPERFTDCCA